MDQGAAIDVVEAERRLSVANPHQPFIDRKRADGGAKIAAIAAPIDDAPVHRDLAEAVIQRRFGAA